MNDIVTPDFNNMKPSELREYAAMMRIPLAKDAKPAEIKAAIAQKLAGRVSAVLAKETDSIPPGHAKILIHEDPSPGAQQIPVYVNANGYQCTIPRGKEVIVPIRVVRVLNDAKVKRLVQKTIQDQYGREISQNSYVTAPSYPFQLLGQTEGPEPLTTLEKQKLKSHGPRARFAELFGYWPKPADLRRAIERGLIKLHEDENVPVPAGSTDMIEEPQED